MASAKNIVSVARNIGLALGLTVGLAACSVVQENPNYQYSSKYQGGGSTSYASNGISGSSSGGIVTTPASYTQASSESYSGGIYAGSTISRAEEECRNKESNREIIGGAAGGAIGAFAGRKLIGGTAGTLAGAAVGGAAGYGLGDISVDCSQQQAYQPAPVQASTQTYQSAPTTTYQASPASYSQPIIYGDSIVAPTDSLYSDVVPTGTPGYSVYQGDRLQTVEQTAQASNSFAGYPNGSNVHTGIQSSGVQANGATEITGYDYSANLITADAALESQGFPATETRILSGYNFGTQSYIVQSGDTVYGLSRKLCVGLADIQSPNNINANYGIQIGQTIQLPQSQC